MIVFKLNKKLYSKKAIEQAVLDYKEICEARIENEKSNYKVILNKKASDDEISDDALKNEFCNYCLGMMKQL